MRDGEPCDVCLARDAMEPYLHLSLSGVLEAWVARCTACGFRQVRPRLGEEGLGRLYPDAYFDSRSGIGFADYARGQQRNKREAFFLAARLRRLAPRGRLLDVGCALGFLLDAVRGYSGWEVCGIDVSPFAASFARRKYGLDVSAATLEGARFPDDSFDFVIQKDLLEHVLRPREHLRETYRITKPGGRVLIVTPNGEANLRPIEAQAAEIASSTGGMLPVLDQGHLSFFRRQHLQRLFRECGFEIEEFRSISVRRGLRALGFLPRKRGRLKRVPTRASPLETPAAPAAPAVSGLPGEGDLYVRMEQEISQHRSPIRGSRLYYLFRHAMEELDSLPGSIPLGYDYRVTLRRPGA